MAKQKHEHVLEQTIIRQVPFDPNDLSAAAVIQQQLVNTAKPMVGFVSQSTRVTKAPVKDELDIPATMKRT